MKSEGYTELFSWDTEKIEEASMKVLKWYAGVFSNREVMNWDKLIVRDLLPMLKRKIPSHPISFPAEDFHLLFRPSDMVADLTESYKNLNVGIEVDPHFVFIEQQERMTPRVRTSIVRANQEIGLEAEEVLGAMYQRFPPTIILPRTNFAKTIYKGEILLF